MPSPILFLHGVTRRGRTFDPLIPALQHRHTTKAIDLRGHGSAPRHPNQYLVADYAADVQLEETTILYGHSMGAMLAALVASRRPELVSALILEDPPFDTMAARILDSSLHEYFSGLQRFAGSPLPLPILARELAEMRYAGRRLGDERDMASLRFTASCLKQLDPAVLDPVLEQRWLEGYDMNAVLQEIDCPVLLLQADMNAGGMLTDEDAARASTLIPDCTLVRFPGKPHLLHWMATQDVLRAVLAFLGTCG